MKNTFSSTEIFLLFTLSTSGKRYMNIVNDDNETAIFMVTPDVFEFVKQDKIQDITFRKNTVPLPRPSDPMAGSTQVVIDRIKQQQKDFDAGKFTYSWVPEGMNETELVDLQRKANMITYKVTIAKGERDIKKLMEEETA